MTMLALKIAERFTPADTAALLAEGGDARIALECGRNEYGCRPYPDPDLVEFGSSTASTISGPAFAAARALHERILANPDEATCALEFDRIRDEFAALCGVSDLTGLYIVFAASGTDAHLIASRIVKSGHAVMVDRTETGRGVPAALSGRHFSTRSALGGRVVAGMPLAGGTATGIVNVPVRTQDGMVRDGREIDIEVAAHAEAAVKNGESVLLVLTDVSKTGMIAPSLSCTLELKARFPHAVAVLVDACQFRISSATLRAYLEQGFMVALTGSKFLSGPTFSGALLLPQAQKFEIPGGLQAYSSRYEWPSGMRSELLGKDANFGLLLRWEAALAELREFSRVPDAKVEKFLRGFALKIMQRLENDVHFEPLPVPALNRACLTAKPGWDTIQTIFPFMLKQGNLPLGLDETKKIYALLQQDLSPIHPGSEVAGLRCCLGQPVRCGKRGKVELAALRLCASARLIVEGAANGDQVIARALAALDKAALLVEAL